jgi:arginase
VKRPVRIIGVPMDLGQSQRGVDMGPSAVRCAGLSSRLRSLGYRIEDKGNVEVKVRDAVPKGRLVPAIADACEAAYRAAREAIHNGALPIFLGGDHSMAIGTVGGVTHESPAGLLWVDAHGDYNTPRTSKSGNVHGMPLAVLLGRGSKRLVDLGRRGAKVKPKDVALLGVRQLDDKERVVLKQSGITVFTMRDIDERGIHETALDALSCLGHLKRLHLSLDMDCLDPSVAPGVGTPVAGGLTYREAHLLMEIVADSETLGSMDIVEINPIVDQGNRTAAMAIDLAVSALGKRIL